MARFFICSCGSKTIWTVPLAVLWIGGERCVRSARRPREGSYGRYSARSAAGRIAIETYQTLAVQALTVLRAELKTGALAHRRWVRNSRTRSSIRFRHLILRRSCCSHEA